MQKEQQIAERKSQIKAGIANFPAMPALCGNLLARIKDPTLDFKDLADDMRYDPGMTANILKLANSAYFGARGEIDSLQAAIVRLGILKVFQMVTAASVAKVMKTELKGYDLRSSDLLRHSVWVAIASEEFARVLNVSTPQILFTAGLLHDIGKIVLDELVEEEQGNLRDAMAHGNSTDSFEMIERNFFGMDHAEAGAAILDKWNFPAALITALRWHHEPEKAKDTNSVVNMVHIADVLAYSQGIGAGLEGLHYELSEFAIEGLNITPIIIEKVACTTLEKMEQIEKLLR